jgi:hypothetical protein
MAGAHRSAQHVPRGQPTVLGYRARRWAPHCVRPGAARASPISHRAIQLYLSPGGADRSGRTPRDGQCLDLAWLRRRGGQRRTGERSCHCAAHAYPSSPPARWILPCSGARPGQALGSRQCSCPGHWRLLSRIRYLSNGLALRHLAVIRAFGVDGPGPSRYRRSTAPWPRRLLELVPVGQVAGQPVDVGTMTTSAWLASMAAISSPIPLRVISLNRNTRHPRRRPQPSSRAASHGRCPAQAGSAATPQRRRSRSVGRTRPALSWASAPAT